jgi:hypothetical protein
MSGGRNGSQAGLAANGLQWVVCGPCAGVPPTAAQRPSWPFGRAPRLSQSGRSFVFQSISATDPSGTLAGRKMRAVERAPSARLNALRSPYPENQPQQGRPIPQHARASQQDAANWAMPGDAANAAELETSMAAAANSLIFIFQLLMGIKSNRAVLGAAAGRGEHRNPVEIA